MLETQHLKLKKIELTDSPPDITVINPNWDEIDKQIEVLSIERGYLRPKMVDSTVGHLTGLYSKWVSSDDAPFDQFNFLRMQGVDPDFISTIGIHPVTGYMFARGNDNDSFNAILDERNGFNWKNVSDNYTSVLDWAKDNPNSVCIYTGAQYTDVPFNNNHYGTVWNLKGTSHLVYIMENGGGTVYWREINSDGNWVENWFDMKTSDSINQGSATGINMNTYGFQPGSMIRSLYSGVQQSGLGTPYGDIKGSITDTTHYNTITFGEPARLSQISSAPFSFQRGLFTRWKHDNNWSKWIEISQTSAKDFVQSDYLNGVIIDSSQQNSVAKSGKVCVLKLCLHSTSDLTEWTTVLNIPSEYRPSKNVGCRVVAENGSATILNVQPDGAVRLRYLTPSTWVGIELSYRV